MTAVPMALALSPDQKWAIADGYEPVVVAPLAEIDALAATAPQAGAVWLGEAEATDLYTLVGNIALISVRGVLLNRFDWQGFDFATGYNGIRLAVAAALDNDAVKATALVIDSGGGMVSGCFELCAWLRSVAASDGRPIVAIVEDWAASAAYAIASSAQTISAPLTGGVGSIGVVRMHLDMSGYLEQFGLDVSLIRAGKH